MAQDRDKERKARRTQEGYTDADYQTSTTGASSAQQGTVGSSTAAGLGQSGEENKNVQSSASRTTDDVTFSGGFSPQGGGNPTSEELTSSGGGGAGAGSSSFYSRASQRISQRQGRQRSEGGFYGAGATGGLGAAAGYSSESNVGGEGYRGYRGEGQGGGQGLGSRGSEEWGGPEARGRYPDDLRAAGGSEAWRPQDADQGAGWGAGGGGGGRGFETGGYRGGAQGGRTGYGDASRGGSAELGYGTGRPNEEAYGGRQGFESERFGRGQGGGGGGGGFGRESFYGTTGYGAGGYGLGHQAGQQPWQQPSGRGEQTERRSRWQREALTAREIMTKNPKSVRRDSSVREIAQIMRDENTGVVPVVDENGRLQGIVTDRDIVMRTLPEGKNPIDLRAADVMTDDVEAVTPDEEVKDVINLMGDKQIRRVPVVDQNDRLLGIISMADIATRVDYDEELQDALESISSRRSFWSRLFA